MTPKHFFPVHTLHLRVGGYLNEVSCGRSVVIGTSIVQKLETPRKPTIVRKTYQCPFASLVYREEVGLRK